MRENATKSSICSGMSIDIARVREYFASGDDGFKSVDEVIAFILSFAISCSNGLVLVAILRRSSLRSPANLLICWLSLVDFLQGFLFLPIYASLAYVQTCLLFALSYLLGWIVNVASFWTMVGVSCERYIALFYHLRYPSIVTTKRITIFQVMVWLLAVYSGVPVFIPAMYSSIGVRYAIHGVFLVSGLVTIVFTYTRIFKLVRRHHHQINAQQIGDTNNARQRKLAVTMAYVTIVSFLCYSPTLIFLLKIAIQGAAAVSKNTERLIRLSPLLFSLSSLLNPLIYCFRNQEIRGAVVQLLRDIKNKMK